MRTLVLVLTLAVISPAARAEGPLDNAHELKDTGKTLAITGAVSFAVSIGLGLALAGGSSFGCEPSEFFCTRGYAAGLGSAITAVIGTAMTVSGVPMWAIGAKRSRRLQRISVAPAALQLRF